MVTQKIVSVLSVVNSQYLEGKDNFVCPPNTVYAMLSIN